MDNNKDTSLEGIGTEGRTFTQEEVNRIVQDRLAKEKGKANEELDKRVAELDKRERRMNAIDELRKHGLPDYLVDAVNMNTDEDFKKSLEAIMKMKGETGAGQEKEIKPGTVILGKGNPIGVVTKDSTDAGLRDAFGLG